MPSSLVDSGKAAPLEEEYAWRESSGSERSGGTRPLTARSSIAVAAATDGAGPPPTQPAAFLFSFYLPSKGDALPPVACVFVVLLFVLLAPWVLGGATGGAWP